MSSSRSNSKPRNAGIPVHKETKATPSQPTKNSGVSKNAKPKVGSTISKTGQNSTEKSKVPIKPLPAASKTIIAAKSSNSTNVSTTSTSISKTLVKKVEAPARSVSKDRLLNKEPSVKTSRPAQVSISTKRTPSQSKTPVVETKTKPVLPKPNTINKSSTNKIVKPDITSKPKKPIEKPKQQSGSRTSIKKPANSKGESGTSAENARPNQSGSRTATKKPAPNKKESEENERPSTATLSSQRGENRIIRNADGIKANNEAIFQTKIPAKKDDSLDAEIDYEDDFEDYESDFEEDENSESQTSSSPDLSSSLNSEESDTSNPDISHNEIAKSVENSHSKSHNINYDRQESEENIKPTTLSFYESKRQSESSLITPMTVTPMTPTVPLITPNTPSAGLFNFAQAEYNITQKKAQTRSDELLELITLDKQTFNIFECPPAKYEVFIKIFGNNNYKQVFVQTEVSEDQSIQTDEVNVLNKWTQNPAHGLHSVGGDLVSEDISLGSLETDGVKLNNFISNTSQLVLKILDEETTQVIHNRLNKVDENISFSRGFFELMLPDIVSKSSVTEVRFSEGQPCYMLSAHKGSSADMNGNGVICIWDLKNQSQPEYILTSSSETSSCSFNPGNPTIVFAGMLDGSIALWDLRESNSEHKKLLGNQYVFYRTATYSTAAVQWETGHHSAIVDLQAFVYENTSSSQGASNLYFSENQFCNLLTLEDLGILNVWTVIEVINPDISGSETDLGLSPGGKLKLLKITSISVPNLMPPTSLFTFGLRCFGFKVQPSNPHNLFIITDAGVVLHSTRQGHLTMPRFYEVDNLDKEIRCLAFNPHRLPYFATGCDDGTIHIHNIKSSKPVLKCTFRHASIISIQWSIIRPTVFFAMDVKSCIQIWDLAENLTAPFYIGEFGGEIVSQFCVRLDRTSESHWSQYLVVCSSTASVKVHKLVENLVSVTSDQYDLLRNIMNDL